MNITDPIYADEDKAREHLESIQIRHHNVNQKISATGDQTTFQYFRPRGHALFEEAERRLNLLLEPNLNECLHAQTYRLWVQQSHIFADEPLPLQCLHSSQARGGRQVNLASQIDVGDPPVFLQDR